MKRKDFELVDGYEGERGTVNIADEDE